MKAKSWSKLMADLPAARRARIRKKTEELLLEADLAELRKLAGKTQAEVAAAMKVSQGQVSETERRKDYKLSTLREYVKALGGELEVVASFGDKSIKLHA
jgi:predicted transcriptional regulator